MKRFQVWSLKVWPGNWGNKCLRCEASKQAGEARKVGGEAWKEGRRKAAEL